MQYHAPIGALVFHLQSLFSERFPKRGETVFGSDFFMGFGGEFLCISISEIFPHFFPALLTSSLSAHLQSDVPPHNSPCLLDILNDVLNNNNTIVIFFLYFIQRLRENNGLCVCGRERSQPVCYGSKAGSQGPPHRKGKGSNLCVLAGSQDPPHRKGKRANLCV